MPLPAALRGPAAPANGDASLDRRTLREVEAGLAAGGHALLRSEVQLAHVAVGVALVAVAAAAQWFNEERSARQCALLARGLAECVSVDASRPEEGMRGRLVHVQGRARGAYPVADGQFDGAVLDGCLKLQSTVEIFERVPSTTAPSVPGGGKRPASRFHTEWTTVHHDFRKFRRPSPENPRPPSGLKLGTRTRSCGSAVLGGFVLTEDLLVSLHRFEPAMRRLPDRLTAHGHVFHANREDGYYYARPGAKDCRPGGGLFVRHEAGDVRAHFMCVPEGDVTVVAVQCERDGREGFVPYRPVPRAPWSSPQKERRRRVEEGARSVKELRSRRQAACGTGGGVAACCLCACGAMAWLSREEVITEEICFVSGQLDPKEKAFRRVVRRNPCRVGILRLLGWAAMMLGIGLSAGPLHSRELGLPIPEACSSSACSILALTSTLSASSLALTTTLSASSLIVAAAHVRYSPWESLRWFWIAGLVLAAPPIGARFVHPS